MDAGPETARLLENLERLQTHVEAVRALSGTARDDIASVLHALVGGDGADDGYGLVMRGFDELGLPLPEVVSWGREIDDQVEGQPVSLALRGSPGVGGPTVPLPDHLKETCVRFAVQGLEPSANWSYLDLTKKVRNKFGSHVDRKPPKWLTELRFFPAGDSDAVTFLLWRAAETTLSTVTLALVNAGVDVERYQPVDSYLDGIDLQQALVLGRPGDHLDVRAHLACARWASGRRRAVVGGLFGEQAFVFGLEGDGRLALTVGQPGMSVAVVTESFRIEGLPRVGRNEECPCRSGRKFKHCHGK